MNTHEDISIGADVDDSDGDKIGTVAYVVVEPKTYHITDIVVSTGAILGRDVVVPIADVQGVTDGTVRLSLSKDELQKLPDYVDIQYQRPPEEWMPPAGMYYPPGGMLWPVGVEYPGDATVTVNAPRGTIGLHEGMDVESSDGHKIGTIAALETDASNDDITGITIKEGFIFHHDVTIPVQDIADITSEAVKLNKTKDELQAETGNS